MEILFIDMALQENTCDNAHSLRSLGTKNPLASYKLEFLILLTKTGVYILLQSEFIDYLGFSHFYSHLHSTGNILHNKSVKLNHRQFFSIRPQRFCAAHFGSCLPLLKCCHGDQFLSCTFPGPMQAPLFMALCHHYSDCQLLSYYLISLQ